MSLLWAAGGCFHSGYLSGSEIWKTHAGGTRAGLQKTAFVRTLFSVVMFMFKKGLEEGVEFRRQLWRKQSVKMRNSTYLLTEDCDVSNTALYKFYAGIMIVIFILALPLNASVLHLFIFKMKFWKSHYNNIFLFSLVLADILLLFCLPIKAHDFIQGQRQSQSEAVRKAMHFMLFLNRGASITFLTITSIDRYFNVVHPGHKNLLKKSPHISILIWLFLVLLTIPTMLKTFCKSHMTINEDTLITVTPCLIRCWWRAWQQGGVTTRTAQLVLQVVKGLSKVPQFPHFHLKRPLSTETTSVKVKNK